MTPRERWTALLNGETPDRIPTDYQAVGEVTRRLLAELDCATEDDLFSKLHIDRRRILGARCKRENPFGVVYRDVDHGTGVYREAVGHPLAGARSADDVDDFAWPGPDDFDYEAFRVAIEADDGYRPIHVGTYEPFLLYGEMRGLEQSYVDLVAEPDIAEAVFQQLFDFFFEHHRRLFDIGRESILTTYVAEDLGSQTGPLMSLETYRRFLLPNQVRMADLARTYGIRVIYHTDGAARPFLDDLVGKVRIDVLNPVQYRCPGMDREDLVRDFGDQIVFHGSIENQQVLPFGSVEDVRREVRENLAAYKNARWICAPCHNLQSHTPTENILALYETIHESGTL